MTFGAETRRLQYESGARRNGKLWRNRDVLQKASLGLPNGVERTGADAVRELEVCYWRLTSLADYVTPTLNCHGLQMQAIQLKPDRPAN
jgi:hypothetical protein